MQLVERRIIKCSNDRFNELDNLCFLSKNLYNATLYEVRQHLFKNSKYLNYNEVNKKFTNENQPDYRALPAKVAKMTQMLVDKSFKSFFTKKKNGDKTAKLPKYLPKEGRQIVNYTYQALSFKKKGYVKLSGTEVYIKTNKEGIKFIRLVPRNKHLIIEIGYEVPGTKIKLNNRYASIDLGINNLATVTSNVISPFIINGKPIKSINQYYNKQLAKEKSRLSKLGLKTSNKVQSLHNRRYNKINDYLHKASRHIVSQLVSNDITTLVIGYNKGWKQDTTMSKINNQKFVSIPFLRFIQMLEYKCKLKGIQVELQEESYTSKASFLDNEDIKKHATYKGVRKLRGLFVTSTKRLINADVNASYNILKKYLIRKVVWNARLLSDCIEVYSTPVIISIRY